MFPGILAAVPLIMHGLANLAGFAASWLPGTAGFKSESWLLSAGVTVKSPAGHLFGILWLVSTAVLVASGAGLLAHAAWWRWAAVSGAGLWLVVTTSVTATVGAQLGALFMARRVKSVVLKRAFAALLVALALQRAVALLS